MSELFETFDAAGHARGLVPRDIVHRDGLWHRSSNVFLFHPDGRLYVQRRAHDKDVCPGLWDLSVGEHLQPGETYAEGALRGLREELGIRGVELIPLGEVTPHRLEITELGIRDFEFQQCFRGVHAGPVYPDRAEIAEVDLMTPSALQKTLCEQPHCLTPWFRFHAHLIDLYGFTNLGTR